VLLTTHLMEEAEKCDRLAILSHGKLVALGSPGELKKEIGGEVVTLQSESPERVVEILRTEMSLEPRLLDGKIRIEVTDGPRFVSRCAEALEGLVDSITLGKPTLEDVFLKRTGHLFWEEEES